MTVRQTSIDLHFEGIAPLIDRWRRATVSVAALNVPPHITLLYPWRPAPLTPADVAALQEVVVDEPTFPVTFTGIGRFANTVYLQLEEDTPVRALMRKIIAGFPETPPYEGKFPDPVPHLTVAQGGEAGIETLAEEIAAELRRVFPLVFTISQVVVMEQQEDGIWQNYAVLPLRNHSEG